VIWDMVQDYRGNSSRNGRLIYLIPVCPLEI
jgi:hypothetical protein